MLAESSTVGVAELPAHARGVPGAELAALILVVEDDNDIRDALEQVLRTEGYEVVTAPNGQAALEGIAGRQPHLILLDLMMPVMNGWQFRARQRQDPKLAEVPVVVISADSSARREASLLGAHAFMQKPFELDDLLTVVAQQLPSAHPAH